MTSRVGSIVVQSGKSGTEVVCVVFSLHHSVKPILWNKIKSNQFPNLCTAFSEALVSIVNVCLVYFVVIVEKNNAGVNFIVRSSSAVFAKVQIGLFDCLLCFLT